MADHTSSNQRLVLTGFMGSGKTLVAEALGKSLNCVSIDLDEFFEKTTGRSPRAVIEAEGEEVFRARETEVLDQLLGESDAQVIALGGGTWIGAANRILVSTNRAISIWLDSPFDLCWERIRAGGKERPLARSEWDAKILYERRRPSYALADLRIEINSGMTVDRVVQEIIETLGTRTIGQVPGPGGTKSL